MEGRETENVKTIIHTKELGKTSLIRWSGRSEGVSHAKAHGEECS